MKEMKIGFQLSLNQSFFVEGYYYELLKRMVKFSPTRVVLNGETFIWEQKLGEKILKNYNSQDDLLIADDNDNYFLTLISAAPVPHRSINIIQEFGECGISNEDIELAISHKEFVSAYLYNEEYEFVQSTSSRSQISERDISKDVLNSIKNTPSKNGIHGMEYDTRFNASSSELISHTWLMVGWRMWFGPIFFNLVSKATILNFPYADRIEELKNGNVFIQLYDDIKTPYLPESVFKQWKWKEWLNYDRLIEDFS